MSLQDLCAPVLLFPLYPGAVYRNRLHVVHACMAAHTDDVNPVH